MQELIITKELSGGRLDKMVAKYLDKAPKGFVYKMMRKKNIVLNGKKAQGNELLKEGDSIRFFLADETIAKFSNLAFNGAGSSDASRIKEAQGRASANVLDKNASNGLNSVNFSSLIIFEDDNLIAVNKPENVLSQKAEATDVSLNEMLVDYLSSEGPSLFTPGISNRLDRNTTGLVLAGKTLAASRELNSAIKERRLDKKYLALVKGRLEEACTIDGYLIKDEKTNTVRIIPNEENPDQHADQSGAGQTKNAARILTAYTPLKVSEKYTLLEVDLITGKSHQIRAHLASIGHPILGDGKYGDRALNKELKVTYGLKRQLLHAAKIVFRKMQGDLAYLNGTEITAPLPEDFERILEQEFREEP